MLIMEALPRQSRNYYHELLGVFPLLNSRKGLEWERNNKVERNKRSSHPCKALLRFWRSLGGNIQLQHSTHCTWSCPAGASGGVPISAPSSHTFPLPLQGCCETFQGGIPSNLQRSRSGDISVLLKSTWCSRWDWTLTVSQSGTSHIAQPALPSPNNKTKPRGNNLLLEFNKQPVLCSQQKNYLHSFPPPTC